MTVITYGKSTFAGNAKTRRHERRRKLAIERDTICNIIDSILAAMLLMLLRKLKPKELTALPKPFAFRNASEES